MAEAGSNLFFCITLTCVLVQRCYASGADEFCLEKQLAGDEVGRIYSLEESCLKCACDGNLKKFCIPDHVCKKKITVDYNAEHRQSCYRDGVKHSHGSQVQDGCNVCTCSNREWSCSTDDCSAATSNQQDGNCHDEIAPFRCKESLRQMTEVKASITKELLCRKSQYLKTYCRETCGYCDALPEVLVAAENAVLCEDKHDNCLKWAKKMSRCQTNRFMKKNCHLSCNICSNESNNEEDNKEVDETAEKSETDPDQLLGDQHDQQFIDEWMQRLQEQGLIRGDNTLELGCQFQCGGKVYPWGSQLQTRDCGLCECKRKSRAHYIFKCSMPCQTCTASSDN